KVYRLIDRLLKFILNHSTSITLFSANNIANLQVDDHSKLDNRFRNLNELDCEEYSVETIDKLVNICKNIQSLRLHKYTNRFENSLAQLIKAQNQIKKLTVSSHDSSN